MQYFKFNKPGLLITIVGLLNFQSIAQSIIKCEIVGSLSSMNVGGPGIHVENRYLCVLSPENKLWDLNKDPNRCGILVFDERTEKAPHHIALPAGEADYLKPVAISVNSKNVVVFTERHLKSEKSHQAWVFKSSIEDTVFLSPQLLLSFTEEDRYSLNYNRFFLKQSGNGKTFSYYLLSDHESNYKFNRSPVLNIYNQDFEIVRAYNLDLPFNSLECEIIDFETGSLNEALILVRIETFPKSFEYRLLVMNPASSATSFLVLEKDFRISDVVIKKLPGGELNVFGSAITKDNQLNGFCWRFPVGQMFNPRLFVTNIDYFPDEKPDNLGLNDLKTSDIFFNDSAGFIMVFSLEKLRKMHINDSEGHLYFRDEFSASDIVVIKSDADGKLVWKKIIPRYQKAVNDISRTGFVVGVDSLLRMVFIYNDNTSNINRDPSNLKAFQRKGKVRAFAINSNGEILKNLYLEGKNFDLTITPEEACRLKTENGWYFANDDVLWKFDTNLFLNAE